MRALAQFVLCVMSLVALTVAFDDSYIIQNAKDAQKSELNHTRRIIESKADKYVSQAETATVKTAVKLNYAAHLLRTIAAAYYQTVNAQLEDYKEQRLDVYLGNIVAAQARAYVKVGPRMDKLFELGAEMLPDASISEEASKLMRFMVAQQKALTERFVDERRKQDGDDMGW